MKKTAVILASILLAACASTPKTDSSQQSKTNTSAEANASALSAAEIEQRKLADEMDELKKQSIYFDFDKFVIKPEYRAAVQKQADFIKKHKNDVVTVEGNADERGSEEYNLALGDKRANIVRKNMELLGVPSRQIKAVSLGEEKPRLTCHAEECWKENRRDDFIHKLN